MTPTGAHPRRRKDEADETAQNLRQRLYAASGILTFAGFSAVPVIAVRGWSLLVIPLASSLPAVAALAMRPKRRLPRLFTAWLMLLALLGATTVMRRDVSEGDMANLSLTVMIGFVAVAAMSAARPAARRRVFQAVVLLALGQVVIASMEVSGSLDALWAGYLGPVGLRNQNPIWSGYIRPQGTYGYAVPMAFHLLVALALLTRQATGWSRRTRVTAAVPLIAGCGLAGSRTAVLLLVVMALFFLGHVTRAVRLIWVVAVTAVGGVLLAYVGPALSGTFRDFQATGSYYHRLGALQALPTLLEQPLGALFFGNGVGGSRALFDRGFLQQTGLAAVDNQIVALLVSAGVLGVCLFATVMFLAVRRAEPALRPALVVALLQFFTFEVLEWHSTLALFCVVLGASMRSTSEQADSRMGEALISQRGQLQGRRPSLAMRSDARAPGLLLPASSA